VELSFILSEIGRRLNGGTGEWCRVAGSKRRLQGYDHTRPNVVTSTALMSTGLLQANGSMMIVVQNICRLVDFVCDLREHEIIATYYSEYSV
jgi:hypothetical protein